MSAGLETLLAGENIRRMILEQGREVFSTRHSGLALVGAGISRYSELGSKSGFRAIVLWGVLTKGEFRSVPFPSPELQ